MGRCRDDERGWDTLAGAKERTETDRLTTDLAEVVRQARLRRDYEGLGECEIGSGHVVSDTHSLQYGDKPRVAVDAETVSCPDELRPDARGDDCGQLVLSRDDR